MTASLTTEIFKAGTVSHGSLINPEFSNTLLQMFPYLNSSHMFSIFIPQLLKWALLIMDVGGNSFPECPSDLLPLLISVFISYSTYILLT